MGLLPACAKVAHSTAFDHLGGAQEASEQDEDAPTQSQRVPARRAPHARRGPTLALAVLRCLRPSPPSSHAQRDSTGYPSAAPQWFAKARRQAQLAYNRAASVKYDPFEDPKYSTTVGDADDDDDDETPANE